MTGSARWRLAAYGGDYRTRGSRPFRYVARPLSRGTPSCSDSDLRCAPYGRTSSVTPSQRLLNSVKYTSHPPINSPSDGPLLGQGIGRTCVLPLGSVALAPAFAGRRTPFPRFAAECKNVIVPGLILS